MSEIEIPELNAAQAMELVKAGALLIDVREVHEWDAGHSPDARLIPMSQLQERIGELPDQERIIVVCQSGMRSERVTQYLIQEGYDAVNVTGGMYAWQAAGFDVVPTPAA